MNKSKHLHQQFLYNNHHRSRLDEEITSKLQAEFDEEVKLAREKAEKEQEANVAKEQKANVALTGEWDDIHAKIKADHELAQRLQAQEQEECLMQNRLHFCYNSYEKRESTLQVKRAEEEEEQNHQHPSLNKEKSCVLT
ncbi:hypothetical protein Tco_0417548 [Tanacetum coccineum]